MNFWKSVRPLAWDAFRVTSRTYLRFSGRQYRYVFILGHMRSGSTLLAHILASHPDFVGAGESHISYHTSADLPTLVVKTGEFLHRPIIRKSFVVDQINHEYVSDNVLRSRELYRCVLLIREPEATLKSMVSMLKCPEEEALRLYDNRLKALTQYGWLLRERGFLVEYNDLIDRPEEVLGKVTRFLDLKLPLSQHYMTHRMTGRVAGYGDPSNNISTGNIIRTPLHAVTISEGALIDATRAYLGCREQLQLATEQATVPRNETSASDE